MTQNTSSSVSFQHAICLKTHYNTDYQAIRKEPQNLRICAQGDYNLKQGEFSEGFCKRIFNTYPHPLPKGGGANLQGKSSLCYGFPSHSNPLVNNKESCNFNLSPREGGANLQGKSSLCYGFPNHSNPLINNKESCNFNLSSREGGANLQGKSSLYYGFPSHSNP